MTRRAPAVAAYALGCFAAMVGWVLWAELARGGSGKVGWAGDVALAVPIALWPALAFGITLWLAARRGIGVSRTTAIAFSAVAGAMTPGIMLIVRLAADLLGLRTPLFGGLFGGLLAMAALGIAFAAWLAAPRAPQPPSP
jgi:hypothetical protein